MLSLFAREAMSMTILPYTLKRELFRSLPFAVREPRVLS